MKKMEKTQNVQTAAKGGIYVGLLIPHIIRPRNLGFPDFFFFLDSIYVRLGVQNPT